MSCIMPSIYSVMIWWRRSTATRFRYIFIDEFQDSNMLQETIIGRIAGKDNLFMVGDVKQSIYKFRLAEPEIFKAKYELYAQAVRGKQHQDRSEQ